jgi:hypothetical protein
VYKEQFMEAAREEIERLPIDKAAKADLLKRVDVRLQIVALQEQLEMSPVMRSAAPESTSEDLGTVVYTLLQHEGPLKFASIMKALGKRHPLLKGVKYPQARVKAAIDKHLGIERISVGVYASTDA